MPTIGCNLDDLNALAGTGFSVEELNRHADLFKGECKDFDPATRELKIELQDTNRPDLWSVEGIARQLRYKFSNIRPKYPWFKPSGHPPARTMLIDPAMEAIRPYAGGFAVLGLDVTEDVLIASIQTQEKLTDNLGRRRQSVSIGIYDLDLIAFPVHYRAVGRHEVRLVPLAFDRSMTPDEILQIHPKGIEYRHILEGLSQVPMLMDDAGEIMSFPPIINSRRSGEVQVGKRNLFIEATGTEFFHTLLALNIFAVNLADRGGTVEPVRVRFPFQTPLGKDVVMPSLLDQSVLFDPSRVAKWLGCSFETDTARRLLEEYGYEIKPENDVFRVFMPSWRNDLLHPVDIIEDLAISAGYADFEPRMPTRYTVGNLDPMTRFADLIRDIVLGFGFEEILSNILCNAAEFTISLREPDRPIIRIRNPMTAKFDALRDRILPSLLRVERDSSSATYPHRIFEVGEVTVRDPESDTGCRTRHRLALLVSDRTAEFALVHSLLEILLYNLNSEGSLKAEDQPLFLPGRAGIIQVGGLPAGSIGEIHPEILDQFEITMPCAAFEIDLNTLFERFQDSL